MIAKRTFYQQPTRAVARQLLGCLLVRRIGRKVIRGVITEVEAYIGEQDLACHAARGRTPRTEVMYGEAGHAYVYLVYGMYFCLNVVTEQKNFPAAVLIRGVSFEGVDYRKTNGPGKLCRFLQIDRTFNLHDLTQKDKLWIELDQQSRRFKIKKSKRIGIDYAKHCKDYPWRFTLES